MGTICENIRLARETKGLTQQEVAEKLDKKRSSYAAWEADTEPNGSVLYNISKILEVSIFDLLGEPDPNINSKPQGLAPEQLPGLLYGELRELVKATRQIAENTKQAPRVKEGIDQMNLLVKKGSVSGRGKKSKPKA